MLLSTAWLKVCIGPVGVCNNAELRALTETLQYISECVLNHWACDMISAQALQLICLWSNCAVQTVIYSLNSIISVSVMKIGSSSVMWLEDWEGESWGRGGDGRAIVPVVLQWSEASTVHDHNCGGWGCEGGWRPAGGLAHGRARGKGFPS